MAKVDVLVTYDISSGHSVVKKTLQALGYQDFLITRTNEKDWLPNTSMVISAEGMTPEIAKIHLNTIVNEFNTQGRNPKIRIERFIAVQYSPSNWAGIKGDPHE